MNFIHYYKGNPSASLRYTGFLKTKPSQIKNVEQLVRTYEETKSTQNKILGISNWKVSKYNVENRADGQIIKMDGTYKQGLGNRSFSLWIYDLNKQFAEVQLTQDNRLIKLENDYVYSTLNKVKISL